jgi:hypothetical protein
MTVPVLRKKPANGSIQMQIVVTDVPALGNCPARKMPTTALIYTPRKQGFCRNGLGPDRGRDR